MPNENHQDTREHIGRGGRQGRVEGQLRGRTQRSTHCEEMPDHRTRSEADDNAAGELELIGVL
jgi:hypothetical protein